MKVAKGYKHTDIGIIPADWEVKKVSEFTNVTSGGTPSTSIKEFWGGQIKWMNSGELNLKRVHDVKNRITQQGLKNSATKLIPTNCILVGLAGQGKTRGTVAINYVELCTNQSIAAILPCNEIEPEYLYQNLDSRYNELRNESTGDGGRGGLNLRILKNLLIPVPSKKEQVAIANALNETDALIADLEKLIAKKQNIKQATMQVLLTGKKRLKGFKGEWVEKTLGDIAIINMGQSPDSKSYNSDGEGLPLIQGNADIVNKKTIKRVWTTEPSKTCHRGDLILTVRAPVGAVAIATENSCIGRGVCSLKGKNSDKHFIFHMLSFREAMWKVIEQGSTFTSANSNQIKQVQVVVPESIDEQAAIASILSDIDNEIEALQQQLSKYKLMKEGMMQDLLTGKVRLI